MTDPANTSLSKLIVHKVGNKLLEDGVQVSDELIDFSRQEELIIICDRKGC